MAKADIGPKIGIDGEREFRKQITDINSSLKVLGSEMKVVTAEFGKSAQNEEALTKQNEILERQTIELKNKLELQTKALVEQVRATSEADSKSKQLQIQVNNTKAELAKAEKQIQDNNTALENMANAADDVGDEFEESGRQAANFGDVLKANIIGDVVTKGIEALANGIKKVGKALKDSIVDSAKYADEMNTLAKQTGLSTDALQEYKYMSDLVDVDLETITGSMSKLIRNMNSARKGTGDAAKAFDTLGINITTANGELRNNQDVFNEVVTALGQIANETERDSIAMAIFGKSAQDLNPLIVAGGEAIAQYAQEAHDMGYVLDTEAINSLNNVNDSFDRLKNAATGIKNQLGQALAPFIEELAQKMQEWVASVNWDEVGNKIRNIADDIRSFFNFVSENGETIIAILAGIAAGFVAWNVTSLIMGLVEAIKAFQLANEGATIAQAALNVVMNANPIGIVITALSALVTAIIVLWNTNEDFRNWCINTWSAITDWIKSTVDKITNWITTAWNNVISFFENTWSFFVDLGRNIAEGIWNGIKNATQWLIGKITGWFNDVVGAVKNFLGISSPSKLFADVIGKNMALGIGEGFESEFGTVASDINSSLESLLPDSSANYGIVSSMSGSGMRSALADSVNAMGMMQSANTPNGNLNITIQANGREFYRATLGDFRLINSQNPIILNDF